MDQLWTITVLLLVAPLLIGFALPKIVRRLLLPISLVVFVISLFGQGVHDDHFLIYVFNLMFLAGSIFREIVNAIVRVVRVHLSKDARTASEAV